MQGVDAVIHCLGTLIEKISNPELTYELMNRNTTINMAGALHDLAFKEGVKKNFVMISSEKAPPFLYKNLTSKIEAENFILSDECSCLNPTIIRPGFIYDFNHRWWSLPLKIGVDTAWAINEKVHK